MGLIELLLVAVSVSMDAFAVCVCKGLGMRVISVRSTLLMALSFGLFQALMPLCGWALGGQFLWLIAPIDHWIAFGLLAGIGGKMIKEAVQEQDEYTCYEDEEGTILLREILVLSFATSIDALAVGISFAVLTVDIVPAVSVIGITTSLFSLLGIAVGHFFGARFERPAEIAGGVILILLGLKILLEHLGFLAW